MYQRKKSLTYKMKILVTWAIRQIENIYAKLSIKSNQINTNGLSAVNIRRLANR